MLNTVIMQHIKNYGPLIALGIISVIIHLAPFFLHGPHPLGYDTGFYHRYLLQPFISFPNTPVAGLGKDALVPRIFLDILRTFGWGPNITLYGGYMLLNVAMIIPFFFWIKSHSGKTTAFLATLFFITSPLQYTAYWFMFFKQTMAIVLLFTTFILIERNNHLAILLGAALAATHHTTTIIFVLTLLVVLMVNRKKRSSVLPIFLITALVSLYMRFDFYQTLRQVPIGVFMETKEFILFSLPLFFFVLFGLKKPWLQGKQCLYLPFASVAIAFPVFALPFYQRIFVFTDIALIIVAAFGLEEMLIIGKHAMSKTRALMSYSIIGIALVWWWGNTLHQITTLNPTPSQMFRGELDTGFNVIPPEATVITSTTLAPWVHGWTHNNVIAPGLLGDPHTIQQWTLFWNGDLETKKTFLNTFPRPLYFVVESQQKEVLLKGLRPCMGQKTPFVFMHNC